MTTQYEEVAGTPAQPEVQHEARTIRRNLEGGEIHMMTEIGDGVFVQWSQCVKCSERVGECACPDGPREPDYMVRWRTSRFAKSFADRGIQPLATPYAVRQLMTSVQEAQDMAYGDSNDGEIDALRDALEEALVLLGLRLPEGRDPDAVVPEHEQEGFVSEIEHTGKHEMEAELDEAVHTETTVNTGLDAALAAVRGEPMPASVTEALEDVITPCCRFPISAAERKDDTAAGACSVCGTKIEEDTNADA